MNEIELWAARDKSGKLYLYRNKPIKDMFEWYSPGLSLVLSSASFPEIKWSDKEPTKVSITIKSNMEKIHAWISSDADKK